MSSSIILRHIQCNLCRFMHLRPVRRQHFKKDLSEATLRNFLQQARHTSMKEVKLGAAGGIAGRGRLSSDGSAALAYACQLLDPCGLLLHHVAVHPARARARKHKHTTLTHTTTARMINAHLCNTHAQTRHAHIHRSYAFAHAHTRNVHAHR